ncbi:MAG: hemolysin family protein [Actinomycetota bacterium]|nr:hemolysin family protein [Actinomycetota bacterium]
MPALRIFVALLLVALNGLFVAAEFAFVRIRTTQIDQLVREGHSSAGLVQAAREKLDQYLAVCQLGITICSLGIGALAEPAIANLIDPLIEALGLPEGLVHPIAIAIALFVASFMHVVFGELAPKTFAIQRAEGTALFVAPFMRFFYYALLPLTALFNGTANTITGALGVPPASESDETHSEEEIRQLIAQSTRKGVLEEDEQSRISGVFSLEDTVAREIMVPRPDVVALSAETKLAELVAVAAAGRYTRYPIHEGDVPDRIVGAVHVKDVLRAIQAEGGIEANVAARDIMREVLIVPENRSIENILEDFQRQELQMAIVIDEWGSFEGLFTIEDIVEEIVGEIRDEFDEEEPGVDHLEDGSYSVDGRVPIGVVNDSLGSGLASEDFDTIGGLVLGQLGRAPETGDEVSLDGHTLRVEETDGPRVARVVIRVTSQKGEEPEG